MGARTLEQSKAQAQSIARAAMTGNAKHKKKYQGRAAIMAEAIYRRFQLGPTKWRVKHILWFLKEHCERKQYAPATRYDYWRACQAVLHGLERYGNYAPNLVGPWMTRTGDMPSDSNLGRKPMLKRNLGDTEGVEQLRKYRGRIAAEDINMDEIRDRDRASDSA